MEPGNNKVTGYKVNIAAMEEGKIKVGE